jgi:RNA polymerase sigma-70 factor, ECF subfamily
MNTRPGRAPNGNDVARPGDGEVVEAVLNGHKERFAVLVERHQAGLFRHARGLGLDPDTAADMVQETLVRAYERLDSCQDPHRFGFWVSRILRNRCLDHLKSSSQQKRSPLPPNLPTTREDPERQRHAASLGEALESALASLPVEQREGFVLRHVEGHSYQEIAELAGASVSAVKMRVHRAREALREQLEPLLGSGDAVTPGTP